MEFTAKEAVSIEVLDICKHRVHLLIQFSGGYTIDRWYEPKDKQSLSLIVRPKTVYEAYPLEHA